MLLFSSLSLRVKRVTVPKTLRCGGGGFTVTVPEAEVGFRTALVLANLFMRVCHFTRLKMDGLKLTRHAQPDP